MIEIIQSLSFNYGLWIGIAIFLTILEIIAGGSFFLLWIAFSALFVGILQWLMPSLPWEAQCLIFSIVSLTSITLWRQYLKNKPKHSENMDLNQGTEKFLGKIFTLVEPISNGIGKVKIADSVWQVAGPDLKTGMKVKVVAVDGVLLKVTGVE